MTMSKVIDRAENVARLVLDVVVYLLLYVFNPGHTFAEVRQRKMTRSNPKYSTDFLDTVAEHNRDLCYEQAKELLETEDDRRQVIDDKSKVLLTVGALLLTANAVLLTTVGWNWLALLPTFFIFTAVFLVLVYFRIASIGFVDLTTIDWSRPHTETKIALSRGLLAAANHLEPQNSFRAGIYRCALRSMIGGLLILAPCFLGARLLSKSNDDPAFRFLESHQTLRDALTGPQGPQGEPGPRGAQGPPGQSIIQTSQDSTQKQPPSSR